MSRLALYLLGPPHVEVDGEEIRIPRRKALALLAYLAVTGRSHSRDSLATLLWPELDQSTARARLRRAMAALREAIDDGWLDTDRKPRRHQQLRGHGKRVPGVADDAGADRLRQGMLRRPRADG